MAANSLPRLALPILLPIRDWWQNLERARKLTSVVSLVVVCGVIYVCSFVASHIEQAFGHKAAASSALYMDSFVEPLVQELAGKATLSTENREALERLLSPASIGKPVVGFRIWIGDRVVFSNHSEIVGRRFAPSAERERAFQGDVVAKFELDAEEEVQERALHAPILEVYAPIRQTGTNRIIALAETSELAVELVREIRAAQYASYVVIASAAIGLLLLFPPTRVLARGTATHVYEAGVKERIVVIEFPSVAAAVAAHDGPAYQAALKALNNTADRDLRIVEGTD